MITVLTYLLVQRMTAQVTSGRHWVRSGRGEGHYEGFQ